MKWRITKCVSHPIPIATTAAARVSLLCQAANQRSAIVDGFVTTTKKYASPNQIAPSETVAHSASPQGLSALPPG